MGRRQGGQAMEGLDGGPAWRPGHRRHHRQGRRQVNAGIKHDSKKVLASILPGWRALKPIAEVMQWAVEAKGYPVGNWKHVAPEHYRDAMTRHFLAWLD